MNYKKTRVGCWAHHNILWRLKNLCDSAMRHKGFCTSYVALKTPPLLNSSRPGPIMPNLSLNLTDSFDSDSKVQSIWFPSRNQSSDILKKTFKFVPFAYFRFQKWHFVTKIVLSFWPTVRNICSSVREKLLKFEAEGPEFAKILRSLEQFIQTVKGQNNFW